MKENLSLINKFEDFNQQVSKTTPSWFNELKDESLRRFNTLEFPTTKNEEWKYTNIAPLLQRTYQIPDQSHLKEIVELQNYTEKDAILIVFVNGQFSTEYSRIKNTITGVKITPLKEALRNTNGNSVQKILTSFKPAEEPIFVLLNRILANDGIYIHIAEKTIFPELIHIVYITNTEGKELIISPRTLINLGKSAEATILESHISFSDDDLYFSNALTDIFIAQNATLHYYKAQKESAQAFHMNATRVTQEANSNFNSFLLTAGGAITRNNLNVFLNGEGSSSLLNGLYAPYDSQLVDNHTCVDHHFPNCVSNQLYKGILNHSARAVFNGKIIVHPIAQKTNSYQLNKNLLLGKECRVDTKPQLEIGADDVKCTHGATIGQLNQDEIFYLQTRSISKKTAIKMLARGFVDDVLDRIPQEEIYKRMNAFLKPAFEAI